MSAAEEQFKQLTKFVETHAGWRVNDGEVASRVLPMSVVKEIRIGEVAHYTLTLQAIDDGLWKAASISSWLPARSADTQKQGTLRHCLSWLDRREAELHHERSTADLLHDVAEGRKGWAVTDRGDRGRWAGRTFDYGAEGAILLSVRPNDGMRQAPLLAQVNMQFSAGPEASMSGLWGDIEPWLSRWEKTLAVPAELAECKKISAALQLVRELPATEVLTLAYLFEIAGWSPDLIRLGLIRKFAPSKVRNQA